MIFFTYKNISEFYGLILGFYRKKNLAIAPAYSLIFVSQNTPNFLKL
ncbi:MAG: hypothetical protein MGG37_18805 [Trichodesmium sp. MAG_R01]|nr:hypothetical protein [Trichodesmium sp. MAG_R01]